MEPNKQKSTVDFIIVGGGSLGASTAYAVIRQWPDAHVEWYIGVHEHTASNDFIKIIRDAYPDDTMVKFANKGMQRWTTEPYSEFFHQTAWIQAIDKHTTKTMNKGQKDRMVTSDEMRDMVGSTVAPTLKKTEELYLNLNVGYADSDLAVEAILSRAAALGVKCHKQNVSKLVIESGKCIGVELDGSTIEAKQTIVSAGAWTPALLEKSNIPVPPGFFDVSAVGVAVVDLTDIEFESMKSMPIVVVEDGGIMLSKRHKVLKITTTETFRITHPDKLNDHSVNTTPHREVLEKMLPQFKGRDLRHFHCPDLLAPYQYPLVDQVRDISSLTVATAGSYHGYKLLTVFGDIVVLCIRGQESDDPLEREIQARCRWQRPRGTQPVHPNIVPKH